MRNTIIKKKGGFTLIEIIIYLGLFGILMSGAIVSSFNIIESTNRNSTQIMIEEEGEFILNKINFVIYGAQNIEIPEPDTSGDTLSVITPLPSTYNPVVIHFDGRDIVITRGSFATKTLNNSNVWLSNIVFAHNYSEGNAINPESVQTTFTLNARTPNGMILSQVFSNTTYLKK